MRTETRLIHLFFLDEAGVNAQGRRIPNQVGKDDGKCDQAKVLGHQETSQDH
jgi:hypothetical protein